MGLRITRFLSPFSAVPELRAVEGIAACRSGTKQTCVQPTGSSPSLYQAPIYAATAWLRTSLLDDESEDAIIEHQDDIILGRRTYDYWVDYWPSSDVEPFATFINSTTKHVATSKGLAQPWANTIEIDEPLSDYVRRLKQQDAGDIGVHGSIDVSRALLAADLVDVLHLVVAPTLAGTGKTLWGTLDSNRRLTLEQADTDPHGNLFLTYRWLHLHT